MRESDKVIAILCADIHLSLRPPRARRKEEDWFKAMVHPLRELEALAQRYNAPILCAGDVFDHWRAEPELVNFAINYLPEMYAIPGQHDLPLHNLNFIKKSAFWTMVLIGRITPVIEKPLPIENNMVLHGFPFGSRIEPFTRDSNKLHVALCHEYFWIKEFSFPNAPEEHESRAYKNRIQGYHAVVFGDNHKGFLTKVNGIGVLNCGGFMRRTSDQKEYRPQIGLLCSSGNILLHRLKVGHESFTTLEEESLQIRRMLQAHDLSQFISGLSDLQTKSFDFLMAIETAMDRKMVSNDVREIIIEALEGRE